MLTSNKEHLLVLTLDNQLNSLLERILTSKGYSVGICYGLDTAREAIRARTPDLVILGSQPVEGKDVEFVSEINHVAPAAGIILIVRQESQQVLRSALHLGVDNFLVLPLTANEVLQAVDATLAQLRLRKDSFLLEARRVTASLQRQVDEMETLARLGRSITGSLNIDSVLSAVVDAAVELTHAEEGSLLLVDESTGELYMRASRNFQEEFVRTFRLPIQDSLAGSVLQTGQAVLLDENTPQKIKTSYLVHSLVYVPLQIHGATFGVLGVDNRHENPAFSGKDIKLLEAVAEFAVIAIENARLYDGTIHERNKLETVLTNIQDGVIVMDPEQRLLLLNTTAQETFNLVGQGWQGKKFGEVFKFPELESLFDVNNPTVARRVELTVEDGRTFNARVTPIPSVGNAITLSDITYLKKLDQIKSEFVSTVSHDLRSPLTAIMGYVELIDRVGPVSDQQKDFISRVQASVRNITKLVDDLLNLGRIEAGFDSSKDSFYLDQLIRTTAEEVNPLSLSKQQKLTISIPQDIPPIYANPVQVRQMVRNLLDNAIKFTPENGTVEIRALAEHRQIIIQVIDSGIGIPAADLPYLFDKFYRASNSREISGTGLGLAIVKSIVESHHGRIWVDSIPGKGSTFTIVLPVEIQ